MPALFPEQTVALAAVVPGIVTGSTFTTSTLLVSATIHPNAKPVDCTITLTAKLSFTERKLIVFDVTKVSIQTLSFKGAGLYCHFAILPVHVFIVIFTFDPAHTSVLPVIGPATGFSKAYIVRVSTEGVQPASLDICQTSLYVPMA